MPSIQDASRVSIQEEVGKFLMYRSSVAPFFRKISLLESDRVIVDFSGVEFMSRSFADEYLVAKTQSKKRIRDQNVPEEVRRMLSGVSNMMTPARHLTAISSDREVFRVGPVKSLETYRA